MSTIKRTDSNVKVKAKRKYRLLQVGEAIPARVHVNAKDNPCNLQSELRSGTGWMYPIRFLGDTVRADHYLWFRVLTKAYTK